MFNKKPYWNGERLESHLTGEILLEHLHRYAMVTTNCAGKTVLDIACGEGYGSFILASRALAVTGADTDITVIEKANKKYKKPNLKFVHGNITKIPVADHSFDIITCFETLEHVIEHTTVMQEIKRVLRPGGVLYISTPDKTTYADKPSYKNPFHLKELYENEFRKLLSEFFPHVQLYRQNSFAASFIEAEKPTAPELWLSGNFNDLSTTTRPDTMYWLAVASDTDFSIPVSGFFTAPENISALIRKETDRLKKTGTYKAGRIITAPYRLIRSLLGK